MNKIKYFIREFEIKDVLADSKLYFNYKYNFYKDLTPTLITECDFNINNVVKKSQIVVDFILLSENDNIVDIFKIFEFKLVEEIYVKENEEFPYKLPFKITREKDTLEHINILEISKPTTNVKEYKKLLDHKIEK